MNDKRKRPRETRNIICAISAITPAIDPKPKNPVITAVIKKVAGYCNISNPLKRARLNSTQQDKNDDNRENKAHAAAGIITPGAAMWKNRQCSD
jgi:hypothetical protein